MRDRAVAVMQRPDPQGSVLKHQPNPTATEVVNRLSLQGLEKSLS